MEQAAYDRYLASGGTAMDRTALLGTAAWQSEFKDGD